MSPTKFYHVTIYIVDVIMWPKFGNLSIYMREVNIISILLGFDQKNYIIWKGGLCSSLIIWNETTYGLEILQQCGKRVKIKS